MRPMRIPEVVVWLVTLGCGVGWFLASVNTLRGVSLASSWTAVGLLSLGMPTAAALRPDRWARGRPPRWRLLPARLLAASSALVFLVVLLIDSGLSDGSQQARARLASWETPTLWLLVAAAVAAGLPLLWWWRRRAAAWAEAIEEGEPIRVRGGRLLLDEEDAGEAPRGVSDGEAVLLAEASSGGAYRERVLVERVLAGSLPGLAARARANVALLDTWAVALALLAAAPPLAVTVARW